jgi:hypothetical protein
MRRTKDAKLALPEDRRRDTLIEFSTKCERVFSSIKKLLTPMRSCLEEHIIEVTECLKAWWDYRMMSVIPSPGILPLLAAGRGKLKLFYLNFEVIWSTTPSAYVHLGTLKVGTQCPAKG